MTSVMAERAAAWSAMACPAVQAAISEATHRLLTVRGRPLLVSWIRVTALSLNRVSLPVLVENSATGAGLSFHAACSYSLISPASLARRWIWVAGTGRAMISGSSSGARSSMFSPWWLRPVL